MTASHRLQSRGGETQASRAAIQLFTVKMTIFDGSVAPNTTLYYSKLTTIHTQPVLTPLGTTDRERKRKSELAVVSASYQGNNRSALSLNMSL